MSEFTQHEITSKQKLLNANGNITEPGFAKKLYWEYNRNDIKASKIRIKEWDYYYIGNQDCGLCLTLSDSGYVSCLSISLLGFDDKPFQMNDSEIGAFPLGKLNLPSTSEKGDVHAKVGTCDMTFKNDGKTRHLYGTYGNYCNSGKLLTFDVTLTDIPEESMVIATPFDKDKHFYYNQKINCMPASGQVVFDGLTREFVPGQAFGVLDWGRGVWTYKNTWYWGSASGLVDGIPFGFNIGYGFGDTSAASENMLFYDGKAHKLSQVTFHIPMKPKTFSTRGGCCGRSGMTVDTADLTEDYLSPWTFTSDDGRFEMDFVPILDRAACTDIKLICSDQHQVFGLFTGRTVLDDGRVIQVKDFLGFAEKVFNKW